LIVQIWINCYNDNPAYLPFGGYKHSGLGKDLGPEAMAEFSIIKSVQSAIDY
jgi:acyl-CoA reductase-like NAD-dependent aldehyde dehydrogenase